LVDLRDATFGLKTLEDDNVKLKKLVAEPTLYFFLDKEFVETRHSAWQEASSCFRIVRAIWLGCVRFGDRPDNRVQSCPGTGSTGAKMKKAAQRFTGSTPERSSQCWPPFNPTHPSIRPLILTPAQRVGRSCAARCSAAMTVRACDLAAFSSLK